MENLEEQAKILFACENPPGKTEVAGSQDALGILLPGINRLDYSGEYWPTKIDSLHDEETLSWLESVIYLKPLGPRSKGMSILDKTQVTQQKVKNLAQAAQECWESINCRCLTGLAKTITSSFQAQVAMFPKMVTPIVDTAIEELPSAALGYKIAGAGGGGYLIVVSETPLEGTMQIGIRRPKRVTCSEIPSK